MDRFVIVKNGICVGTCTLRLGLVSVFAQNVKLSEDIPFVDKSNPTESLSLALMDRHPKRCADSYDEDMKILLGLQKGQGFGRMEDFSAITGLLTGFRNSKDDYAVIPKRDTVFAFWELDYRLQNVYALKGYNHDFDA